MNILLIKRVHIYIKHHYFIDIKLKIIYKIKVYEIR